MKNILFLLCALFSTLSIAGDKYYHHHYNHHRNNDAWIVPFIAGATVGAIVSSQPRIVYTEPRQVYIEPPIYFQQPRYVWQEIFDPYCYCYRYIQVPVY